MDTIANDMFAVDYFYMHPEYKKPENYFDVGLVKIIDAIEITWEVGPACLPFQNSRYSFENEYVTLLGEFNG